MDDDQQARDARASAHVGIWPNRIMTPLPENRHFLRVQIMNVRV
jgi:hypothetical protein